MSFRREGDDPTRERGVLLFFYLLMLLAFLVIADKKQILKPLLFPATTLPLTLFVANRKTLCLDSSLRYMTW